MYKWMSLYDSQSYNVGVTPLSQTMDGWMDGWMVMKEIQKEADKPACIPYIPWVSLPASPQQSGMTPPSRGPETRREIRPSRQYLEAKLATGGVGQQ